MFIFVINLHVNKFLKINIFSFFFRISLRYSKKKDFFYI
jgi:hypothetical protein